MLLDLRDGIRNSKWLKYLLVTIICIPFALFGVNSYFSGGGPDYAAKVNGEKVSLGTFQNAYQNENARMRQMFGGQMPEGLNTVSLVGNQAMNAVITQEVMRQATVDNNFAVSDEDVAKGLFSVEAFNVDGRFDKERYQLQLQSMGLSPAEFEEQYRVDLVMQQLQNSVLATGFSLPDEESRIRQLREQQRNLSYISLDVAKTAETIEVSEADISTHYDDNINLYNNPEKVTIEYIELNIDDLKSDIEVTEEDIRSYYDQNKTQWVAPEQRDASHILLSLDSDASDSEAEKVQTQAQELIDRINAGEAFEDLAKEFSEDSGSAENGGSLGEFGEGVMVPEFEEAAFAMTEGEISAPVRSDFGVHIIRLNKIIGERGKAFEEVKDEVENLYRTETAENRYFEVSEQLQNAAYENSDSLEPAADETGLEVKTSDWIDSATTDGIGSNRQVLAAALSDDVLNSGLNSETVELGEYHSVVLRTVEHEPPAPKPLEEVTDDIRTAIQTERATEQLGDLADQIVEQLQGGGDAAAIAAENDATFSDTVAVARSSNEVDRALITTLFTMPKPAEGQAGYETVTLSDGNLAVAVFSGIAETTEEATEEEAPDANAPPLISTGPIEFQSMMSSMEQRADIVRNEALLSGGDSPYPAQ
jgi:peptidyl-prolyl cis-trans isomerase D